MRAWYNEIDGYCCDWLSNLMDAGHIAPGVIDDRSIEDIDPDDVRGFERCHFFAGIAGWDLALQLAGWPDDRPVWTGSCPCQPFSGAGRGKAADDERHLWPAWMALIRECKPPRIFGEQVEAAIGWGWLDVVFSDLEAEGYACGAAVLPACGVGAPHIRQRLWFVAQGMDNADIGKRLRSKHGPQGRHVIEHGRDSGFVANSDQGRGGRDAGAVPGAQGEARWQVRRDPDGPEPGGTDCGMADAHRTGRLVERGGRLFDGERAPQRDDPDGCGTDGGMGNPGEPRPQGRSFDLGEHAGQCAARPAGPWDDLVWLPCSDGKARPAQPGIFPLASRVPGRVGRLRAYGNAIVPQAAAAFITASLS